MSKSKRLDGALPYSLRGEERHLIFNFVAVLINRQRAFFISTVTRTPVKTFGQSKGCKCFFFVFCFCFLLFGFLKIYTNDNTCFEL